MRKESFTPADYLTEDEKGRLDELRKKIKMAVTLPQLQVIEVEVKALLKTAYYRKRSGWVALNGKSTMVYKPIGKIKGANRKMVK